MGRQYFFRAVGFIFVLVLLLLTVLWPIHGGAENVPSFKSNILAVSRIPVRPPNAITGSEFARRTAGLPEDLRQQAALAELRRGNIPQYIRSLKPITLTKSGQGTAMVWVTPDYLSIGSDDDFLRIPLTLPSALEISNEFGCTLPTPKIVDAIYRQSALKLTPQPLPAGQMMRSNEFYMRHQQLIQGQLINYHPGDLISGHKKDVVFTKRLRKNPGKIAIYGWHKKDGCPIQPLSTVHEADYADYSHGIRLVSTTVSINGEKCSIFDALRNPAYAPLLTDEGMIEDPETLAACNK